MKLNTKVYGEVLWWSERTGYGIIQGLYDHDKSEFYFDISGWKNNRAPVRGEVVTGSVSLIESNCITLKNVKSIVRSI